MNKANECTCPSGDGSLVHPCPAHPAVEQVGGDERAAFEAAFAAMGRPVCRADYDQDAYGTPFDDGGWTGWQARAALAQPSPVLPPFAEKVLAKLRRFYDCASDFESGGVDIGRHWLDLLTQLGLLNRVQRSPALWEISQHGEDLLEAPVAQAQHSVPDGAADLCRFLAKLYCELDGLRYSTAKLPAEQIADALIFKWPVLQGARNQLNIKRISEQPYDESKLHSAIAAMLAAAPGNSVPQAWLDVQAERRRQITAEGWTPEHDDEHADGQMAQAAGCYALHAGGIGTDWPDGRQNGAALFWPWDKDSWKPTTPRRDLVKACALALAEIERLDRAGISQSPQPGATTASS
ncbi:hypothetical protein ACV6ZV_18880, partial [Pseudomonas aeruginosa]